MADFRTEKDSMGEERVRKLARLGMPAGALTDHGGMIGTVDFYEKANREGIKPIIGAEVNAGLKLLAPPLAEAISRAAREVLEGKFDDQFVLDVFQTGSGTSTNMNVNEVLANRANELLGKPFGSNSPVHPNDHVNRCQSSNDVIPSAIRIAARRELPERLLPALSPLPGAPSAPPGEHSAPPTARVHRAQSANVGSPSAIRIAARRELSERLLPALCPLRDVLSAKAGEFSDVLKIGRTHMQDAVPVTLGQEFSGYASQIDHGIRRVQAVFADLEELPLGGTAVGTGLNAHPEFGARTIAEIADATGIPFRPAENRFEAMGAQDPLVAASGALKGLAVSLMKISQDIRLLSSGPRCGIGEINLPSLQPGSSIMPGKVNPVILEMAIQVAAQAVGNDLVVTLGGSLGVLELNGMLPVMGRNLRESSGPLPSRGGRGGGASPRGTPPGQDDPGRPAGEKSPAGGRNREDPRPGEDDRIALAADVRFCPDRVRGATIVQTDPSQLRQPSRSKHRGRTETGMRKLLSRTRRKIPESSPRENPA